MVIEVPPPKDESNHILSLIADIHPILPRPKIVQKKKCIVCGAEFVVTPLTKNVNTCPKHRTYSASVYVSGVGEVNSDIEEKIRKKKEEWLNKGYSKKLVEYAMSLAIEWAASMSSALAPPHVRSEVFKYNLDKGFEVAERWLMKITE